MTTVSAKDFLASVVQSGEAVSPDVPDGLNVVDSSGDESDASYPGDEPEPRGAAVEDADSTDEGEPNESAGRAYEFPKIDVSAEGKILINETSAPKSKVKELLLKHEEDQIGTRPTWAELKKKLSAAKVPGYDRLIEACKKAPAKPKQPAAKPKAPAAKPNDAPATAASKTKPKQTKPSAASSPLSSGKAPPTPAPAPAPTAQPTPDPTPEPAPAPVRAPKRPISKPAPARRKRGNEDVEADPVPTKVASVVQPGGQTTLADMRLAIAAYNDQLGPLGVEFTLTPTERPSIE